MKEHDENNNDRAKISNDMLVSAFVELRDRKDAIKAECDTRTEELTAQMDMVTKELMSRLLESGSTAFKTSAGTATVVEKSQAQCHDWAALEEWVIANNRLDMFARRLNVSTVKEYIDTAADTPPGVRIETTASVQVRRATRK